MKCAYKKKKFKKNQESKGVKEVASKEKLRSKTKI